MEFHKTFLKTSFKVQLNLWKSLSKIGGAVFEKKWLIDQTEIVYYY